MGSTERRGVSLSRAVNTTRSDQNSFSRGFFADIRQTARRTIGLRAQVTRCFVRPAERRLGSWRKRARYDPRRSSNFFPLRCNAALQRAFKVSRLVYIVVVRSKYPARCLLLNCLWFSAFWDIFVCLIHSARQSVKALEKSYSSKMRAKLNACMCAGCSSLSSICCKDWRLPVKI